MRIEGLVMDIKVGQKVKNTLTGTEYKVKKILQDNSVILHSENGNASALIMINKDRMKGLFDILDSESRNSSNSG
jgi:hypothetical protein